jgi:hypothetical protein
MATGARKSYLQVVQEISLLLTPASPLSGIIGYLPGVALVNGIHLVTAQGWDSTTATLALGTTPGGVNWLPATNIKPVARQDILTGMQNNGVSFADTPIWYTLAFTGPIPALGQTVVYLDFIREF